MGSALVRHIFIGDVHGCLDELEALVRKVRVGPADQVVFVGDLVAKGPDSAGVVAYARELKALAVRGNHDEAVLRIRRARRGHGDLSRAKRHHLRVADSLCETDWRWLEGLPLWLRFPEFGSVVVHAGMVPGKPVQEQRPEDLMTMRTLRPDGHASPRLEDGVLWAKRYGGPERVIFGHDAITGFQKESFAIGLDTGCVYGRTLTAFVLPSGEYVSVQARRAYREIER